jgi:Bacterial Ig-like domain (group 3)
MSKARNRIFVCSVLFVLFFVTCLVPSAVAQDPFFTSGNLVVAVEGCGVRGGTCTSVPNGSGNGAGNSSVGGYGDNQAAPLTLFQYSPSGTSSVTFVNSLVFPQAGSGANLPVSGEYGSSSEGTLQLSGSGQYLTIMGYGLSANAFNSSPGTYSPTPTNAALAQSGSLTGQTYTAVPRVLTLIDPNGNVNSSTAIYNIFNTNNPRSAFTLNGTTAYVSGQGTGADLTGGVFYVPVGAADTSPTAITGADTTGKTIAQDSRDVQILNNTLYISVDSKEGSGSARDFIGTLGTPPATSLFNSGNGPTQLTGFASSSSGKESITSGANSNGNGLNTGLQINLSPVNYFFASPSVLYVADSGAPKNNSAPSSLGDGGLQKWVNSASNGSGTWSLAYTLYQGLSLVANTNTDGTSGLYGLTGTVSGNTVYLYATNYTLNDLDYTYLYGITDNLTYTLASQASSETFTLLDTAPADSNFKGVSFAPTLPPSTVQVVSSVSPSIFGQSVTFTATVTSQGNGAPTGTVTFTYGGTTLCNAVPLTGSTANCAYSILPPGSDTVTANYSGDTNFAPGTGNVNQLVSQSGSATTVSSSLNPSTFNQQVTFTATVAGQLGGTPTGSVTFYDGSTTLGTAPLSAGTAAFSTATLPVGLNSITAAYSGDTNFTGSSSSILIQHVGAVGPLSLQANIAGSTAFWLEAGEAAYSLGGTTNTCAWTTSLAVDGSSFVIDQRVPANPQYFPFSVDYGALWVTWTPGTAGGTCAAPDNTSQVWAYISLDSVLGDRCFFAQPQCTLNVGSFNQGTGAVTPLSAGTAGANALPGITDTPIPASVLATFNGQTISMAATDILPVDAKFASYSVLSQCGSLGSGTQFVGLGYGPGPFAPQPIYSYFSEYYMNVNDFNVYGTDPADGNPIPSYSITPVGAIPVIVAVNTTNSNGFGSPQVGNLSRYDVGLLFTDLLLRTADAIAQPFAGPSATYYGISALIPSPLSGSYNIFEHSIANSKELYRSLDIYNCDPYGAPAANPLIASRTIGSNTSYRYRVIGTSQMLSELQSTQDSIGFELWSAENFANTSNIKYVSVDGVDPLFNTYSDGTIPQSGNGLLPNVTLSHVADGSYPIWNEERLISSPASAGAAAVFASYTQAQLSFGAGATRPDFIPDSQLNVFHMHFAPSGVTFNATNTPADGPKVCGPGGNPEDGGDVGGLVLSVQAGADVCVLYNNYGVPGGIGPTSLSSFGTHQ